MKSPTHADQQDRWDKEHQKPAILLQIDATTASSGVRKFYTWLKANTVEEQLQGIEMCCGKGRNAIWLATKGIRMVGTDFSPIAITEAKRRAIKANVSDKVQFVVHDATKPYDLPPASLNFAIDCFGSTDIESIHGRKQALRNILRVLKPGGFLMIYLLSTEDEYSGELLRQYPGPDSGSYIHPTNGKYEKAFSEQEIKQLYGDLQVRAFKRVPKKATFFDKEYSNNYIWAVFQKI
jgi:ubiquinone/menaquinone biosynthesis C-methylase UbiE